MTIYGRPRFSLERLNLLITILGDKLDNSQDNLELVETYEYLVEYAASLKAKHNAKAMLEAERILRSSIEPPVQGLEE